MAYECVKQVQFIADKNKPIYIKVPHGNSLASCSIIGPTGTALKTYYSNMSTPPAGIALFMDRVLSGEIALGVGTISVAQAGSAAGLPVWAGTAAATDKVIKVELANISSIAVGDLLRLRFSTNIPDITGRVSYIGSGFVEISRVASTVDMTKVVVASATKASVFLKIKQGRFGEPYENVVYNFTIQNINSAIVDLPTAVKLIQPTESSWSMVSLEFPPFVRDDITTQGTNRYGAGNMLFKVLEIIKDTQIRVELPDQFGLSVAGNSFASDQATNKYLYCLRTGIMGAAQNYDSAIPSYATADILRIDGVTAGASINDACLAILTFADNVQAL